MIKETDRVLFYEKDGAPVTDTQPYLTDLWQQLAKENETAKESLDYSKLLGPISAAHQDVKAVLTVLDHILSHTPQQLPTPLQPHKLSLPMPHDSEPALSTHSAPLYLQAAHCLRTKADALEADLKRDAELAQFARELKAQGWPVQYSKPQGAWVVDYGYKCRFARFWEHLRTIEERGTFAIISAPYQLTFPATLQLTTLLINNKCAPKLCEDLEVEYIRNLKKAQQMLMERDLFELLKEELIQSYEQVQVATNRVQVNGLITIELRLSSEEEMALEEDPRILQAIYDYITNKPLLLQAFLLIK